MPLVPGPAPALSPPPSCQVFQAQLDASYDYRADPTLHQACGPDAQSICAGVEPGGGRIQACLMSSRIKLGWDCEEQLFRKEMEDADDMRLSVRLFRKCLNDKRQVGRGGAGPGPGGVGQARSLG
ncbi:hypothetical protein MNEG_15275 [Monoraphidium neglectum]|uniref:Uncharacterized protein n=1 Tax=Monoraphidium neglectum TaxID=145388 RepID=A0A0D2LLP0_9CHLO|nr:hypothetical protein MNEG_15275 [Monoraphidium neglectum]KIY92689.1 hypothetical protein MNEG_15275 [Monoraphidium neglectum]|eukprot:XP_013891709.1 hypothetical protein MNEG_15275 [Monoraphidium neglectum]